MKNQEAVQLVKKAFGGEYNSTSFEEFISNLFKEYTALNKVRDGQYIREAYRTVVEKYRIVGTFKDAESNVLDILEVFLCKESSLDKARTAQRNFVADYLKKHERGAALVAFVSPGNEDWRFSLVKLEYSPEFLEGKLRISEEITPAKRWSFLVGKHEGSHTVQSRFKPLLEHNEKPILRELEEAFNIETVTDEFFVKYCDLFFRMKTSLDGILDRDPAAKADFDGKELSTGDFCKKTLGQMAFLYFLQKKGWFGVFPNKEWGSGVKNFLRVLFDRRKKYGNNFFNSVLEPLFYEALAQDRGVESIYPRLNNCRMPFLNGGLFEPMNGYSWETTDICLPDDLFSNTNKTEEGDIGDGILDIFDRYNFTVNENEPLEKEVAVDPEMLGKVFENLLEVLDRKSKGTYYTPREIVHYMCQESLINYLHSEVGGSVSREDLEILIRKGSQIVENDQIVSSKGKETSTWKFLLPKSIRDLAKKLDDSLANIKVCDPAVGSGAFPLGMLNEIIQARRVLGVHLKSTRTVYDLKLHGISHSIYGVDIDPGAVEIAKLRLWLALVVEENEPHPLPNLEHKIMQGNSLLSEYEGIKLFDDAFVENSNNTMKEKAEVDFMLSKLQQEYFALHSRGELTATKKFELERDVKDFTKRRKSLGSDNLLIDQEMSLFVASDKYRIAQEKTSLLQKKIERFISEPHRTQKQILKDEIDTLKWELIEATLRDQNKTEKLAEIKKLRRANIRPFFIWKLEFSDVFKEKGGFDISIANPPYVFARDSEKKGISEKTKEFFYKNYTLAEYQVNLYPLFVELSTKILNATGSLCFITPNNWMTINTNTKIRELILRQSNVKIVNFFAKVFKSASVDSSIIIFQTGKQNKNISLYEYETDFRLVTATTTDRFLNEHKMIINIEGLKDNSTSPLLHAIENGCKHLSELSDVKAGLMAYEVGKGIPNQTKKMKDERVYHSEKKEDKTYIKYVDGKDVSRYKLGWSGEYLKYGSNLASPRNIGLFNSSRILVRQIPSKPPYCIHACHVDTILLNDRNSMNVINLKEDPYFLLGVLNSKALSYWFIHKFGKLQRGIFPQFKINELEIFPIPVLEKKEKSAIAALALKISKELERGEISVEKKAALIGYNDLLDDLVYAAFRLDQSQIKVIQESLSKV